jgi:hypothetical protein
MTRRLRPWVWYAAAYVLFIVLFWFIGKPEAATYVGSVVLHLGYAFGAWVVWMMTRK